MYTLVFHMLEMCECILFAGKALMSHAGKAHMRGGRCFALPVVTQQLAFKPTPS